MKVLYNAKENAVRVKIETPEELVFLKSFISPGCVVKAKTLRSREIVRNGRKVKVGKEKAVIAISVEKTELKENALKLLGRIVESSSEASGYHSLSLTVGSEATIKKCWQRWEIERLRKLAAPAEKVLACILDEKEAWIYVIGDTVEEKGRILSAYSKFSDASLKSKYFWEIFSKLKEWKGKIVIAGPGFAKDELKEFLKERNFEMGRVFVDSLSHTGLAGVNELLKRKTLERVAKESRISRETEIVEKFFEELAKNGLVVYGREEVEKALEAGALEKLLVSTKLVEKYRDILEKAEKSKTELVLISSRHPAGERFYHFCGIAGFLRYRME